MRQNIYDNEAFFRGYADLRAHPGNRNDLVDPLARCPNCLLVNRVKPPSVTPDVTL